MSDSFPDRIIVILRNGPATPGEISRQLDLSARNTYEALSVLMQQRRARRTRNFKWCIDEEGPDPVTNDDVRAIADTLIRSTQTRQQQAGFILQIGNLRISLCDDPRLIAIDRDGEGGHFLLTEFSDMVHRFVSDRL